MQLSNLSHRRLSFLFLSFWLIVSLGFMMPPALKGQQGRAAEVSGQLDSIFSDVAFARGWWAVKVKSMTTGEVLYERNPYRYVMPASNMKLPTALAAMQRLGLDFSYTTVLARQGQIEDGTLQGDLVVVGGGDPTLGARLTSPEVEELTQGDPLSVFRQWAVQLKEQGIYRVSGDLVGDVGIFDSVPLGEGWSWDDVAYGYSAAISGLQFNENVVMLRIEPALEPGQPVRIRMLPQTGYIKVVNQVTTVPVDGDFRLSLRHSPESRQVVVSGELPVDSSGFWRSVAVFDPAEYFLAVLRETLSGEGIEVEGEIRLHEKEEPLQGLTRIASHDSPKLDWILNVFLKISQNLYGETLVKTLDRSPRLKRYEDGREEVESTLTSAGIPPDSYILRDGSGLSRYNFLSADMLIRLLEAVHRHPQREAFVSFLPVSGESGTISRRMKGTAAEGRVQAKTGTLANVRALSGFITTQGGEVLAFSMIANNFAQPMRSAEYLQDAALAYLATLDGPSGAPR
ncbi:MAG TPA: D-alanyl-D-alanine carboxypeptidase/D-alanyl-D-alanine-endopeptidase [Acidobacteriota bacterium]|nr:D-alanyl-D-alanine carboxypeptidase/D-alanyl-D-alanine-endopeptidase [Acidobacteriota bacterium]